MIFNLLFFNSLLSFPLHAATEQSAQKIRSQGFAPSERMELDGTLILQNMPTDCKSAIYPPPTIQVVTNCKLLVCTLFCIFSKCFSAAKIRKRIHFAATERKKISADLLPPRPWERGLGGKVIFAKSGMRAASTKTETAAPQRGSRNTLPFIGMNHESQSNNAFMINPTRLPKNKDKILIVTNPTFLNRIFMKSRRFAIISSSNSRYLSYPTWFVNHNSPVHH